MTKELAAFLRELADLLDKHHAVIEPGDYAVDFGIVYDGHAAWTSYQTEVESHDFRYLADKAI